MSYGYEASLEHVIVKLSKLAEMLTEAQKENRASGDVSVEQRMIVETVSAVAYLADAVRYLKDGVR